MNKTICILHIIFWRDYWLFFAIFFLEFLHLSFWLKSVSNFLLQCLWFRLARKGSCVFHSVCVCTECLGFSDFLLLSYWPLFHFIWRSGGSEITLSFLSSLLMTLLLFFVIVVAWGIKPGTSCMRGKCCTSITRSPHTIFLFYDQ